MSTKQNPLGAEGNGIFLGNFEGLGESSVLGWNERKLSGSCWFRDGRVWIWICGHRAFLVSALGLGWWELSEKREGNCNAQLHSWRKDQDGRGKAVELLGAGGEQKDLRCGGKSCGTKPEKGAGWGGRGRRARRGVGGKRERIPAPGIQQGPGEDHFPSTALSGILIMKVQGNDSFVLRFGMKGALPEGNIHLLKFCWIQEKREAAAGE